MKQIKFTQRLYELVSFGVKTEGSYNPDEISYLFEESLTEPEYSTIYSFLKWVHLNGKMFGSGNYSEVFNEWRQSVCN